MEQGEQAHHCEALTLLPAHGLAHMDACDIIHIPYPDAGLVKNNEIECTYYIPVTWM